MGHWPRAEALPRPPCHPLDPGPARCARPSPQNLAWRTTFVLVQVCVFLHLRADRARHRGWGDAWRAGHAMSCSGCAAPRAMPLGIHHVDMLGGTPERPEPEILAVALSRPASSPRLPPTWSSQRPPATWSWGSSSQRLWSALGSEPADDRLDGSTKPQHPQISRRAGAPVAAAKPSTELSLRRSRSWHAARPRTEVKLGAS